MASRTLVVVRHSKAERQAPTDFERQLSDRGRVDGADLGAWLAQQGVVCDAALVSAAHRTEETWAVVTRVLTTMASVTVVSPTTALAILALMTAALVTMAWVTPVGKLAFGVCAACWAAAHRSL